MSHTYKKLTTDQITQLEAQAGNEAAKLIDELQNAIDSIPAAVQRQTSVLQRIIEHSANLFDLSAVTEGYFINDANGNVTASANYCYSDYIPVKPNTVYSVKNSLFGGGCYDNNLNFVPWTYSNLKITTPASACYMRLSMAKSNAATQWCVEGTGTGTAEYYERVRLQNLPTIPGEKVGAPQFTLLLPDTIHLINGSDFSIYYDAIVYPAEMFDKRRYAITQQTGANGVKGETYDYKWHYTPAAAGETFTMVFAIRDLFTNAVIASKSVNFVVSEAKSGKSKNVILMGDSFMDGYGITGLTYGNIVTGGNALNVLGVNSADSSTYPNLKDNAWAGQGLRWVSGGYAWSKQGGLRSDRPLEDAYWDEGWGEGETHGWQEGGTYADLTAEQKAHGHSKNEFFNPTSETFDLSYYLETYQNGATCDILINQYGLNDVGWLMDADENPTWTVENFVLPAVQKIVDSAIEANDDIRVGLCLLPPSTDDNNAVGVQRANGNNRITNRNIQYYNKRLLELYGENENVILIPSHCNFDTRYGYLSAEYQPVKFDASINETHSADIHPSTIGAKYYADSITNVLYNLL